MKLRSTWSQELEDSGSGWRSGSHRLGTERWRYSSGMCDPAGSDVHRKSLVVEKETSTNVPEQKKMYYAWRRWVHSPQHWLPWPKFYQRFDYSWQEEIGLLPLINVKRMRTTTEIAYATRLKRGHGYSWEKDLQLALRWGCFNFKLTRVSAYSKCSHFKLIHMVGIS